MSDHKILIGAEETDRVRYLSNEIQHRYDKFEGRGDFVIGLSGGSLPDAFVKAAEILKVDWSKVKLIFCDERMLPESDPESTFGVYKRKLLGKVPGLDESCFVKVDTSLSVEEAAIDYEKKLIALNKGAPFPKFEVLLLGMGPDGHTCSLFPGHSLLEEKSLIVAPISDSPKPPPERVTLTLPVLHNSDCIFVATGDSKKQILKEILKENSKSYPAGLVALDGTPVVWILDEPAASLL